MQSSRFGKRWHGDSGREPVQQQAWLCGGGGSLVGDVTRTVARSPEEALLYLVSPGSEGCVSAQVFEEARAALLLPATSSSLVRADASAASQMSFVHADGRARYQNLPPKGVMQPGASSDPLPFPPAALLAEGAAGSRAVRAV